MASFLLKVPHCLYVIEQADDGLFNRGALLNAGFQIAQLAATPADWYIFHDVDLLPSAELLPYYSSQPEPGTALHIGSRFTRYPGETYFGGITSFREVDFLRMNGFPNDYEGWGGEDDELRRRAVRCGVRIVKPGEGSLADLEGLSLAEKLSYLKSNNLLNARKKEQKAAHKATWRANGLNSLSYKAVVEADDLFKVSIR